VVAGWNHVGGADGKRRSERELSLSMHRHMPEFGSTKEQQPSSQITILPSDDMAAIAKMFLRVSF
jgi:hypothetical protein